MKRKICLDTYLDTCKESEELLLFCKKNNITTYSALISAENCFPEEKHALWFKMLCSPNYIRFLKSRGIQ